ncbi:MAG: hypothetical protein E6Q76_05605 [Rhizobium sp.]|nr:MAG: hypothetical protein E6Q76_05605 [Rhizobium sp.]
MKAYLATPRGRMVAMVAVAIPIALFVLLFRKPPTPPHLPAPELMLPAVPATPAQAPPKPASPEATPTVQEVKPTEAAPAPQVVKVHSGNPLDATVEVALSNVPLADEVTPGVLKKAIDEATTPLLATIATLKQQVSEQDLKIRNLADRIEDMRQQRGDGNLPAHKIQIVKYELIEDSLRGTVEARLSFVKTDDDPVFYKIKSAEQDHQVVLEVLDAVVTAQAPEPISFLTGIQTRMEGSTRKFIFSSESQIEPQIKLTGSYLSVVISQIDRRANAHPDRDAAGGTRGHIQNDDRTPWAKGIAAAWVVKAINHERAIMFNRELRKELDVKVGDEIPYSGKVVEIRDQDNTVRTIRDVFVQE